LLACVMLPILLVFASYQYFAACRCGGQVRRYMGVAASTVLS